MTPRFLVFDWDGTLADSHTKIVNCFRKSGADEGLPDRSTEEIRDLIGLDLHESTSILYPELSANGVQSFVRTYRSHWLAPDAPKARLFSGARELLDAARARGHTLAVATGKSRAGLSREMGETGLEPYFAATRCADETRSKPHPQMLHELLHTVDADPARTVVIGDTTFDLEMAARAGVASIAVTYGAHRREALEAFDPITCCSSVTALLDWLLGREPASDAHRE